MAEGDNASTSEVLTTSVSQQTCPGAIHVGDASTCEHETTSTVPNSSAAVSVVHASAVDEQQLRSELLEQIAENAAVEVPWIQSYVPANSIGKSSSPTVIRRWTVIAAPGTIEIC